MSKETERAHTPPLRTTFVLLLALAVCLVAAMANAGTKASSKRVANRWSNVVASVSHGKAVPMDRIFCNGFEIASCGGVDDHLAPLFLDAQPESVIVAPGTIPTIGVTVVEEGSGVDSHSLRFFHDDVDVSTSVSFVDNTLRYALAAAPAAGDHSWRIEVRDNAGNGARYDYKYRVTSTPTISAAAPLEVEVEAAGAAIEAAFSDSTVELDRSGVVLRLDGADVDAALTWVDARSGRLRYVAQPALTPGRHAVELQVRNAQGAIGTKLWGFWIKEAPQYSVEFLQPAEAATVDKAELRVAMRVGSNRGMPTSVLINGEIALTDSEPDGTVFYYRDVRLAPGSNILTVVAGFEGGETRTVTRTVVFNAPPVVRITAPRDFQTLGPDPATATSTPVPGGALALTGNVEHPVRVTGSVDRAVVRVEINQRLATLDAAGTGFAFERFFLHEGTNVLTATAFDAEGRAGTSSVTVYVDHTAPLLLIESPQADAVTSAQQISLRGSVEDAVSGAVGTPEPVVAITNRSNAVTAVASVYRSLFLSEPIRLDLGVNELEVRATDGAGNVRTRSLRVSRVATGSRRIVMYAGDHQQGEVGTALPHPLVVHALGADGMPLAGAAVTFDILRGDGSIARALGQPERPDGVSLARNLAVQTDAQGVAEVWLTLGSEAGVASNAVRARMHEAGEEVLFTASAQRGTPKWVLPDGSAGTQYAAANSRAIEPLGVVVYDEHRNRVESALVEYEVLKGDAHFDDLSAPGATPSADGKSLQVRTDRNGIASVRPWLGFTEGTARIVARAAGVAGTPGAVFEFAILEQKEGDTSFVGKALDHTGRPLAGVRFSIGQTSLSATSDADGNFRFASQVPPGKIDLFVDGRDAPAAAGQQYPALHFETAIVRGRDNQLPHPIYLPPLNLAQTREIGGDQDVSLTVPGLEGFELVVKAGSVTFPDGSHVGPAVVSVVNGDRLPMVPPGGSASFGPIAWTLQPSGTRFDPPVEVRIPNTGGLKAGETTSIVQWDHDLATFVPMGIGVVNESATQIVSLPGSGITKAGWGGCTGDCPPPPPNCGTGSNEPHRPQYQEVKTYKMEKRFFGLFETERLVPPDRLSLHARSRFKDKTFSQSCDSYTYEWQFGDGGTGAGEQADHQYRERGETTAVQTIVCHYTSSCDGTPGTARWVKELPVRVRDQLWIEYQAAMDECGWTAGCWLHLQAQEALGEISEELSQLEIEWLADIQGWNRERLDELGPGGSGNLSEGQIAALAVLHAANESVFPTGIPDVLPLGKLTRGLKLIKGRYGATVDELAEIATRATRVCRSIALNAVNAANACLVGWERFEEAGRKLIERMRCRGACLKSWKPARNVVNGFDGAVIWRDEGGRLRLTLTESKLWSIERRPVVTSDLTAFGLGEDASTLQRNLDVVIENLEREGIPGVSRAELDVLLDEIRARKFDVAIHVLHENRLDWAGISQAIHNITGRFPEQIVGW